MAVADIGGVKSSTRRSLLKFSDRKTVALKPGCEVTCDRLRAHQSIVRSVEMATADSRTEARNVLRSKVVQDPICLCWFAHRDGVSVRYRRAVIERLIESAERHMATW